MDRELLEARIDKVIELIKTVTKDLNNVSYEKFIKDDVLCRATCFSVEQICEQLSNKLRKELESAHPEIEWSKISGMRISIAHIYEKIDYEIIFKTVKKDLPILEDQLSKIKNELSK